MGMRFFKVGWVLLWSSILTMVGTIIVRYGFLEGVKVSDIRATLAGTWAGLLLGLVSTAASYLPSYLFWGDDDHTLVSLWCLPWTIEENRKILAEEKSIEQDRIDKILRAEGVIT